MSWLTDRPVLATILTGLGLAMLIAGAVGLFAPVSALDRLWALGDLKLAFVTVVLIVASLAITAMVAAAIAMAKSRNGDDQLGR